MAKKNRNKGRTAIWSVPEKWKNIYFMLFHIQLVLIIIGSAWRYLGTPPRWVTIYAEIVESMPGQIFFGAVISLTITEIYKMLSDTYERWLKKTMKEKFRKEGRVEERRLWNAWNARRELAQSEGREFDELPPDRLSNRR